MKQALISSGIVVLSSGVLFGASSPTESNAVRVANAPQAAPAVMTPLAALARAHEVGATSADQPVHLCVSLTVPRLADLEAFAESVSNPYSPNYRNFIEPDEVGARFGLETAQVEQVSDFLRENGFTITLVGKNRMSIMAEGTVGQAQKAFQTTIRDFTLEPGNSTEPSQFFAYSTAVRVPANLAPLVIDVSGLETYTKPQPRVSLLTPTLTRGLYDTAPMFTTGFTGTGRVVAVSNFDGFRANNWMLYISHFALPVPAGGAGTNIITVPTGGGSAGAGTPGGEGDLDIQMELGMAPLATIRIYDADSTGGNLTGVLTTEVNDNQADAISESYGWNLPGSTLNAAHNLHVSMSSQGITYMAASGDNGTNIGTFGYPNMDPEVLSVGGTTANVSSPSGARLSEVGWAGSGGGWSTNGASFNVRPSWQVGTGVPAITGTNNHRLFPDVAFHAASGSGAYQFYANNTLQSGSVGTSFASPIFTGMLTITEQYIISLGGLTPNGAGKQRFGRIANLIYGQNGRSDIWHDITSGNNGNPTLPDGTASTAHAGWDTVTGWGPMDCFAFAPVASCATGQNCGGGGSPPGTGYCFGDGSGASCPCANFGVNGSGCANSVSSDGALLVGSGVASVDPLGDTLLLTGTNMPNSSALYFQGTTQISSIFGDGIRCTGGSILRLGTHTNVAGTSSYPSGADVQISIRGAVSAGSVRNYQVWYRNADPTFCTASTFNLTNGYNVTWTP